MGIMDVLNNMTEKVSSRDPFLGIFEKFVEALNLKYVEGTCNYIENFYPGLYQETNNAQDKLDETWKACRAGKMCVEMFKRDVDRWYNLVLQQIDIYKKSFKNIP